MGSRQTLRQEIAFALCMSAAIALPVSVNAQSSSSNGDDGSIETVIVTGSNIRRADVETAAPIQIITRDDIDNTGRTTIGEYLQTLTADGQGSVPRSFGSGFAAGAAGVSLRGLGAGSTLVLLNNRRIAPYGLADDGQKIFTDLSVIPLEVVERVEVLKEGASAVYGSDAIAGVVNIILRPEYQGFSVRGSYGMSEEGDGDTAKLSLTGGFGDLTGDGWNVYFNVEGSQSDRIRTSDRAGRKWIGSGDLRPYGYSVTGSQFLAGWINGTQITNSPTGTLITPGDVTPNPLPGCEQFAEVPQDGSGGGCIWDAGRFRDLTPEQSYVNVFGRGTLAIGETMRAYAELGYSRKKSEFSNTPSGVSGAWGYPGGPVNASSGPGATVLGPTHPDNILFPGESPRLRYSAWDVGPRIGEQTNEFYRAVVGLEGSLGEWEFDVAVLHSESDLLSERRNFLRYSRVLEALSGTGPVTWRIGANSHLNTKEVYDYISPPIHADGKSQLDAVDVTFTRSLFELPGGPLGVALGAEYRRMESSLSPQTYTDIGDIIGLGYSAFEGTQNEIAGYVEFLAPILPQVEVSAAVRHDSYMNADSKTTPKFGVKWQPADMIAFRGTYAKGFRTPNPAENGKGGTAGFANTQDPVRCPNGVPIPGASDADCNVNVAIITKPNPDLKPEESESYTIGLVFSPFDNTTLTIDGWQIRRTNEIKGEDLADAIARGDVVRNDNDIGGVPGTGTLLAANANYVNADSTKVRGIDVSLNQLVELGAYGRLSVDFVWTRINSLQTIDEGGVTEYAGSHGNCDITNCIGTPKNRMNVSATWLLADWTVGLAWNFRGEMDNTNAEGTACANSFADGRDAPRGCRIPSFHSLDLSARWQATDSMQIFANVENALDRVAPLDPHTYGAINYNPLDSAGAIGRYFTVGMRYSFGQ
jgi:iron complex outermembrane receptor protein